MRDKRRPCRERSRQAHLIFGKNEDTFLCPRLLSLLERAFAEPDVVPRRDLFLIENLRLSNAFDAPGAAEELRRWPKLCENARPLFSSSSALTEKYLLMSGISPHDRAGPTGLRKSRLISVHTKPPASLCSASAARSPDALSAASQSATSFAPCRTHGDRRWSHASWSAVFVVTTAYENSVSLLPGTENSSNTPASNTNLCTAADAPTLTRWGVFREDLRGAAFSHAK